MSRMLDAPPDSIEPLPMSTHYCDGHGRRDGRFVIHEFLGIQLCMTHLRETIAAEWRVP